MNVYQMSMVSVMGMLIATIGISHLTDNNRLYPFVIGFIVCIAFLVQSIRSLQKQIDEIHHSIENKK